MELVSYINRGFRNGLSYDEAAQLCLRLYCSLDGLPESLHYQCTKENLADAFSSLASSGFIKGGYSGAVIYGANFHSATEKGHWVEVIASIFKKQNTVNMAVGESLINRLTQHSSGTR
ncbi:MAG: hypothetical protein ACAH12_01570 [Methylophilaceae bacterium]